MLAANLTLEKLKVKNYWRTTYINRTVCLLKVWKNFKKKDAMTKNDRIFFVLVWSIYRRFSLGSSTVNWRFLKKSAITLKPQYYWVKHECAITSPYALSQFLATVITRCFSKFFGFAATIKKRNMGTCSSARKRNFFKLLVLQEWILRLASEKNVWSIFIPSGKKETFKNKKWELWTVLFFPFASRATC